MPKFEYYTLLTDIKGGVVRKAGVDKNDFMYELNRLGGDGWELVSIEKLGDPGSGTAQLMSVFKREIIPPEVIWQNTFNELNG